MERWSRFGRMKVNSLRVESDTTLPLNPRICGFAVKNSFACLWSKPDIYIDGTCAPGIVNWMSTVSKCRNSISYLFSWIWSTRRGVWFFRKSRFSWVFPNIYCFNLIIILSLKFIHILKNSMWIEIFRFPQGANGPIVNNITISAENNTGPLWATG